MVYSQTRGFSSPTLVGLVDTINIICSNEDIEIISISHTVINDNYDEKGITKKLYEAIIVYSLRKPKEN